jgi:CRISPR-associated endonuclease Csn1
MKAIPTVWAFDLGKASIGEAVRKGNEFPHKASLLIPEAFADTKPASSRRRMWRIRVAHRERERWLEIVWAKAGLPVLHGRNRDKKTGAWSAGALPDKPLEQEFPAPGDDAIYTSCLLRIKLLRQEKMKDWEIFKALRSAMQKRGYEMIPWAEKEARRAGKSAEDLEKEEQKMNANYVAALNKWRSFKKDTPVEFHFPCYYDAWKMELWSPATPDVLAPRITNHAQSTRNVRFDRPDVVREIIQLANNAAELLPALAKTFAKIQKEGWTQNAGVVGNGKHFSVKAATFGDFLCYGPAGRPYASFYPDSCAQSGLRTGSSDDWMGVLGQKIPRFDNRILNNCVLIPRFHVCKEEIRKNSDGPVPASLLPAEVTFLMKLKNTMIEDGSEQRKLTSKELGNIFAAISETVAEVKADAKDWPKNVAACFSLTKSDWKRTEGIKELELRPLPGQEEIKPPRDFGRSRFSRPALRLLKGLILSGQKPKDFYKEQLALLNGNSNPMKGLVPNDLKFLLAMGDSWAGFYIPTKKLDSLEARHTVNGQLNREHAVSDMLGDISDPIVRHRLGLFVERIQDLEKKYGMPDEVVLKFIREDFIGPKRLAELRKFQSDREKARKEARKKAKEAGAEEKSAALKYELLKDQGGICLFTGDALSVSHLSDYDIEHIVPRNHPSGIIGPDAMVNYVITKHETNTAKGRRTPFEWFHADKPEQWDAYAQRVQARATQLRYKKVQLLLREDAPELVERYTALAETAWISKLARTIVSLFFGWKNGIDTQGRKRVTVISGGLTARIRRKYRLNSLLNPCPATEDAYEWEGVCEKKTRDKRHHALDAMVISFIPGWQRNPQRKGFFRLPDEIHKSAKEFFQKHIAQVTPENICFPRSTLAETIYGAREAGGRTVIVKRADLFSLCFKSEYGKMQFNLKYLTNQLESIRDGNIRARLKDFIAKKPDESQWKEFCEHITQAPEGIGSHVRTVLVNLGDPVEYKDLSKDGSGAYKRALKGHQGQILYTEAVISKKGETKQVVHVRPVYAFESVARVREDLAKTLGKGSKIVGFFQAGCLVEIESEVPHDKRLLLPGKYTLNTIQTDCRVKLTSQDGTGYPEMPIFGLAKLLAAGFKRIS